MPACLPRMAGDMSSGVCRLRGFGSAITVEWYREKVLRHGYLNVCANPGVLDNLYLMNVRV